MFSLEHDYTAVISYSDIVKEKMKKRIIKLRNPDDSDKKRKFLKFDIVKVTGSCCWRLKDRYRGQNNPPFDMSHPGEYQPGWPIRSVQLLDEHPDGKC